MGKRRAESQLTKDNAHELERQAADGQEQDPSSWKASSEVIAGRKIRKAKRKTKQLGANGNGASAATAPSDNAASATSAFPTFDFGAGGGDDNSGDQKKKKSNDKNKEEETKSNSSNSNSNEDFWAKLRPPATNWECPSCAVSNKQEADKCAACEVAKPSEKSNSSNSNSNEDFWAKLRPPATNWECPSCAVSNKQEADKCAACEAAKPDDKQEKKKKKEEESTVTFGAGVADAGADAATSLFSFGDSSSSGSTFSFDADGAGFTFGATAATGGSNNLFAEAPKIEWDTNASLESNDASSSSATAAATVKLTGPVERGDDKDETLHKVDCKVFRLRTAEEQAEVAKEAEEADKAGKKTKKNKSPQWKECGQGALHVNLMSNKKGRMVLRVEKTHRLVLNTPIFAKMQAKKQGDKYVVFASFEEQNKPVTYLLKFKSKTAADGALQAIEKCKTMVK
eukprot:TRINITY_DN67704_c7_g3_i1.p1 TRINITY_DN67704_c7_g3~~TRINITY_DN67704_c7_g3_i1.p1  ORF type:complete len:455 (+),score=267.59 TRINITY_DN67704_c7_g3_i1:152-1516(+)